MVKEIDITKLKSDMLPIKITAIKVAILNSIKKVCGLKNIDQVIEVLLWKSGLITTMDDKDVIDLATKLKGGN